MNIYYPQRCTVCRKSIMTPAELAKVDGRSAHKRCTPEGKELAKIPAYHSVPGVIGPKTGPKSLQSKLAYDSFIAGQKGAVTPLVSATANLLPHDWSIPLIAPEGLSHPPFQVEGIHHICSRRNTLLADEMGLGKTVQAIGFLNNSPDIRQVLIVTPASLRYNWKAELSTWLVKRPLRIVGLFPETNYEEVDILISSPGQLSKIPDTAKFDAFILDEAHMAKNEDAQRSRHIRRIANRSRRLLFMTGSPIENRTEELWNLLQILDPDTWDPPLMYNGVVVPTGPDAGFHRFATEFCGAKSAFIQKKVRMPDGSLQKKKQRFYDFKGATNLERLHIKLKQSCMVRRMKKDVLPELPEKIRELIVLPPPDGELLQREHEALRKTGLDYESDIEHLQKALILFPDLAKARHESALAKVPYVVEHVEKLLERDAIQKVVVFAHHQDVLSALVDAFDKYQSVVYRGESTEAMRDRAVRLFQTNPDTRVFVGSLTAAGVGLTLTAASHTVFAETDWKDMRQAEDRTHRMGQKDRVCVYQTLVFDWSIDANMMRKILEKMRIARVAIDGEKPNG